MPLADDAWLLSPPAPSLPSNPSSEDRLFKEGPNLTDKEEVQWCQGCKIRFSLVLRKHNCRVCGSVFCGKCSCVVHLIKTHEKKGTCRIEETLSDQSRKTENSLTSLSVKLLGVRVCSSCQDIDSATAKKFARKKPKPLNNSNNISKSYSPLSMKSPANELGNKENLGCDLDLLRVLQNCSDDSDECRRDPLQSTNEDRVSATPPTSRRNYSHPLPTSSTSLSCPLHIEILQLQSSRQKVEENGSESSSSTTSTSSCTQLLQDSSSEEFRQSKSGVENISSEEKFDRGNDGATAVIGSTPNCRQVDKDRIEKKSIYHQSQSSAVKGRIGAATLNSSSWYEILWSCFASMGRCCFSPSSAVVATRTERQ